MFLFLTRYFNISQWEGVMKFKQKTCIFQTVLNILEICCAILWLQKVTVKCYAAVLNFTTWMPEQSKLFPFSQGMDVDWPYQRKVLGDSLTYICPISTSTWRSYATTQKVIIQASVLVGKSITILLTTVVPI